MKALHWMLFDWVASFLTLTLSLTSPRQALTSISPQLRTWSAAAPRAFGRPSASVDSSVPLVLTSQGRRIPLPGRRLTSHSSWRRCRRKVTLLRVQSLVLLQRSRRLTEPRLFSKLLRRPQPPCQMAGAVLWVHWAKSNDEEQMSWFECAQNILWGMHFLKTRFSFLLPYKVHHSEKRLLNITEHRGETVPVRKKRAAVPIAWKLCFWLGYQREPIWPSAIRCTFWCTCSTADSERTFWLLWDEHTI